jgi:uncharacterized protein (TIRG00374 family)
VKRALKLIASLLVTLVFTWWAFRGTRWSEQWASLRSAHYVWLIPYLGVLLLVHLCRTLRWGHLLAGQERIGFRALNEASGIGFMMLLVLPFRLGEFARPFLIAQRSQVKRSAAMTTVVLERIVDGLSVATLMRVLLFFLPGDGTELRAVRFGANIMFLVFGGGLAFLLLALSHQDWAVRLVQATLGRFWPSGAERVSGMVDTFVGALRQLPARRDAVAFFVYTAAYWALNGLGMSLLGRAFDCAPGDLGCTPFLLTPFRAYVVLCVLVVGVMIPAAPGMVGTFQAFVKLGLSLFMPLSVVNSKGLAYANVLWLAQTGQQVLLGLILLSISQLSFRDLTQKLEKEEAAVPG